MPKRIILLTGTLEAPALAALLEESAPALAVEPAHDAEMLRRRFESLTPDCRLVAFCTDVIVPADLLFRLAGPAYNFHPGPPEFRGSRVASFAVYEGARTFGATAHEISSEIDAGAIVGVRRFDVPDGIKFSDLEALSYDALLALFRELAPQLAMREAALPPLAGERWSGPIRTRAQAEKLAAIEADLSEEEIRRRYRAFG